MFNAILFVLTENKIFKRNNEWKRQREKKPGKKSVHPCMLRSKKQMNIRAFVLRFATEHYTEDKWQKIKVFLTVQSSLRII